MLHAPACVQRFSAQRRILARLQALTRRRGPSEPAPELENGPLALQVEENPNWPAAEDRLLEGLGTGLREWRVGGASETTLLTDLLERWGELKNRELKALNEQLRQANLPLLTTGL